MINRQISKLTIYLQNAGVRNFVIEEVSPITIKFLGDDRANHASNSLAVIQAFLEKLVNQKFVLRGSLNDDKLEVDTLYVTCYQGWKKEFFQRVIVCNIKIPSEHLNAPIVQLSSCPNYIFYTDKLYTAPPQSIEKDDPLFNCESAIVRLKNATHDELFLMDKENNCWKQFDTTITMLSSFDEELEKIVTPNKLVALNNDQMQKIVNITTIKEPDVIKIVIDPHWSNRIASLNELCDKIVKASNDGGLDVAQKLLHDASLKENVDNLFSEVKLKAKADYEYRKFLPIIFPFHGMSSCRLSKDNTAVITGLSLKQLETLTIPAPPPPSLFHSKAKRIESISHSVISNVPSQENAERVVVVPNTPTVEIKLAKVIAHDSVSVNCSIEMPLRYRERFKNIQSFNSPHQSAATGSTYTAQSGKQYDVAILDSAYSAYLFDQNNVTGVILAVADGFGGHYGDSTQDYRIAEAAKLAITDAAQELSHYSHDQLTDECLLTIANRVGKAVKKAGKGESCTLACGRVFQGSPQEYSFIGFSVGDSLIAAWDPETKKCMTLLPGKEIEVNGMCSPAPITSFNKDELNIIRVPLPKNCILMAMTDGVHSAFSNITETVNANMTTVHTHLLDQGKINNVFEHLSSSNVGEFKDALLSAATTHVEKMRKSGILEKSSTKKLGDDATCVMTRVSEKAFKDAYDAQQQLTSALPMAQTYLQRYKQSKNRDDYDNAKHCFMTADSLFTINDDCINKMNCLIGMGYLSLYLHNATSGLTLNYGDPRERMIIYALEVMDQLQKVDLSEEFEGKHEFISNLIQFLTDTSNIMTYFAHRWKIEEIKYAECKEKLAKTLGNIPGYSIPEKDQVCLVM